MSMRYDEAYRLGRQRLFAAGIEEADLDARLLLEFTTGADRNVLFAHPDREVTAEEADRYLAFLDMRCKRIPLQHITNAQSFMGLEFYVDENVLIPRADTEILAEEVLRDPFDGCRILDICSGSGCILLSLLHYSNDTTGTGLELSKKAIEVSCINRRSLGLDDRAQFLNSDLLEKADGYYDIVVSNPPYIKTDVIHTLMPEVRDHEPLMALDGKDDGLYFYKKILSDVIGHVRKGSRLYFEIGYDQGQEVSALCKEAGFIDIRTVKDYAGCDRVVCGVFGG